MESYEEAMPATLFGLEKYLGSGLVKGFRPKVSKLIVSKFGMSPMNYEDIWQKQDEITEAVNSLSFSLWDLHYDHSSFAFHMELNEHP